MEKNESLKVKKIEQGTVIDHIPKGRSLIVLKILGITGNEENTIAVLINVESQKLGRKDIVKIENRELTEDEVNLIALVAPTATINIVRECRVIKKYKVALPSVIRRILSCTNPTCITNAEKNVETVFEVLSTDPVKLRCTYCWSYLTLSDILSQLVEAR
ncbi:MAG: aspartate carbamoyltransferase regulatory subunit [Crenarchaeota archaeon]|nr:aspartate carbamoyltransferase regulatory subunit [Thermoproteota archaeon]